MSDETETDDDMTANDDPFGPAGPDGVEGFPQVGCVVELTYDSAAGGSHSTSTPTEVRGEVVGVDVERYGSGPTYKFRVHDRERGRFVGFPVSSYGVGTVKSFADRKQKRGRAIGSGLTATFTDECPAELAPVYSVISRAEAGDTISVYGTEYAVSDTWGVWSVTLTRGDAHTRWKLALDGSGVRFKDPNGKDLPVKAVRFVRERVQDGYSHQPADVDLFPAPHGAREGERVTVEFGGDARAGGEDITLATEQREWTGVVESVDYDLWENADSEPKTVIALDDGGTITFSTRSTRGFSAMVSPEGYTFEDGDGNPRPFHVDSEDITVTVTEGGEDADESEDGGERHPEVSEPEDTDAVREFLTTHGADTYLIQYTEDGEDREVRGVVEAVHSVILYVNPEDGPELGIPVQMVQSITVPDDGHSSVSSDGGVFLNHAGTPEVMTDGGRDIPTVAIPGVSSDGENFHRLPSPCSLLMSEPRERPVNVAQSRGYTACSLCDPPTFGADDPPGKDGEVVTDGGEGPEALAGAVSEALAASDIRMARLSVYVTELDEDVTVSGNGGMAQDEWKDLRDRITGVLDAEGFAYRADESWAFVEVTGRNEVMTDGGEDAPAITPLYRRVERALDSEGLTDSVDIHPEREGVTVTFSGVDVERVEGALLDAGLTGDSTAFGVGKAPEGQGGKVRITPEGNRGDGDE